MREKGSEGNTPALRLAVMTPAGRLMVGNRCVQRLQLRARRGGAGHDFICFTIGKNKSEGGELGGSEDGLVRGKDTV